MKLTLAVLMVLVVLDWAIFNMAHAVDPHHEPGGTPGTDGQDGAAGADGAPGADGADGVDGLNGAAGVSYNIVDDDTMDSIMATAIALSVVEFSANTRKTQLGCGVGHYSGKNSVACGLARLIETENSEFLAVGKIGWVEDENEVAVGVGATWLLGD